MHVFHSILWSFFWLDVINMCQFWFSLVVAGYLWLLLSMFLDLRAFQWLLLTQFLEFLKRLERTIMKWSSILELGPTELKIYSLMSLMLSRRSVFCFWHMLWAMDITFVFFFLKKDGNFTSNIFVLNVDSCWVLQQIDKEDFFPFNFPGRESYAATRRKQRGILLYITGLSL